MPPYVKLPCQKWHKKEHHFLLYNETIEGKHWEEDIRLLGLAFQNNNANCLVLILHRQLGNYLLDTRESYGNTVQHILKTYNKSMFDTCQQVAY